MPSKRKFKNLLKYLDEIDSDFYQMIYDLCLDRLFSPRGVNGITFLYPQEKSYRHQIMSIAYSNNPEKAIQMIESLIILDYLPRYSDFWLKREDIPNSLKQKILVESVNNKGIKLSCGSVLKLDIKFMKKYKEENIAFYNLTGAPIPLDGNKSDMRYIKEQSNKKNLSKKMINNTGSKIHAKVMKIAQRELREKGYTDVFTRRAYSFCQSLMSDPNSRGMFWKLFGDSCITESGSATYMNALDPLTRGNNIIPDVHFQNWIDKFGQVDLDPLTDDNDIEKSWRNFYLKARKTAEKHKPFCDMDNFRIKLQNDLLNENNPILQERLVVPLYKKLRPDLKSDELISLMSKHERNFLDAFFRAESIGEDPEGILDNYKTLMGFYERTYNITKSKDLILTKTKNNGMIDPAGKRTKQTFKVSDMIFGSPRVSDGPGNSDLLNFLNPAEREYNSLVNATVATRCLQTSSGRKTLKGIEDLIQSIKKGGFFDEGVKYEDSFVPDL